MYLIISYKQRHRAKVTHHPSRSGIKVDHNKSIRLNHGRHDVSR